MNRPCRSGHIDCTVDCGWCKGTGIDGGKPGLARPRYRCCRHCHSDSRHGYATDVHILTCPVPDCDGQLPALTGGSASETIKAADQNAPSPTRRNAGE